MSELTPMLKQYREIKEKHPNELLFFRLGDFYELFGEDARQASGILDIVLTARHKGAANETPMCGVPHHALESYLAKLLKAGKRVAICDQVSDPSLPGIVKREVTQVVTPGTTLVNSTLQNNSNNYIASLTLEKNIWGLAVADLTTGEFLAAEISDLNVLKNELFRIRATEVIINKSLANDTRCRDFVAEQSHVNVFDLSVFEKPYNILTRHFKMKNLQSFGLENMEQAICAAGRLLAYLKDNQKSELAHITKISRYNFSDRMVLDEATIRNLELFRANFSGEFQGSLLSVIDKTTTSMGGRMFRRWLFYPLLNPEYIEKRLEAVGEIKQDLILIKSLIEKLKLMADLERLMARLGCGRGNARDCLGLKKSLTIVPEIKRLLEQKKSALLIQTQSELDNHEELVQLLDEVFVEEPPALIVEGGMIKDNYNEELDELRKISRGGKDWLLQMQAREVERTGISSLKVKFNRVFGYYIEISNANLNQAPDDYIRKQTLVNAERFITPELKEYEEKILGAEEKICNIERQIFLETVEKIVKYFASLQKTTDLIARLDIFLGLAVLASENNFCRPVVNNSGKIKISSGRHPVIEKFQRERYVPNDLVLDHDKNEFILLTGPNMSGKSSFLRQTALIVLMAQTGSFVSAEAAEIGVVDRIFTRVGASDNLTQGVSTFMAEMQEAANILNNASKNSLIILDEPGRGTSTYDGVSIAWAMMEHIHNNLRAKTLFATHYHELTSVAENLERAENYCVAVSEDKGRVVFLHKIVKGATSESYGIEVAKIAGLPEELTSRANEILAGLENRTEIKLTKRAEQTRLALQATPKEKKVSSELANLKVDELTPLQALQKIAELKDELVEL